MMMWYSCCKHCLDPGKEMCDEYPHKNPCFVPRCDGGNPTPVAL